MLTLITSAIDVATGITYKIEKQIQIGQRLVDCDCISNCCSTGITNAIVRHSKLIRFKPVPKNFGKREWKSLFSLLHSLMASNTTFSPLPSFLLTSFVKPFIRATTCSSLFMAKIPHERKRTSLTDGNSFLGLHSHHVCNGKPPDKAVTFLMLRRGLTLIMKIVHFSVSVLMLNSECMVLLHLKHKIICSWFLSHHSYSDFIYHVTEIPNHI